MNKVEKTPLAGYDPREPIKFEEEDEQDFFFNENPLMNTYPKLNLSALIGGLKSKKINSNSDLEGEKEEEDDDEE